MQAPVENGGTKRAALADKSNIARARDLLRKRAVQSGNRVHHTQAVRTYNTQLAPFQPRQDLLLERRTLRTIFTEAGGDHDGCSDSRFYTFADDPGHGR